MQDLNLRPSECKSDALATAPIAQLVPRVGLEPTRSKSTAPQAAAVANYATWAFVTIL